MSEFSDRPFVAGTLVGLRAFNVDSLGRLIGPTYGQVFKPGENDAECRRRRDVLFGGWHIPPSLSIGPEVPSVSREAVEARSPKHTLAGVNCGCGFYAYFDGGNDYGDPSRVTAIIEGYGVCTVGARGFRASKARLLALVNKPKRRPSHLWERMLSNYAEVQHFADLRPALSAHPLSIGEVPTPADDDFWTRDPQ